jgi:hypothetical protein
MGNMTAPHIAIAQNVAGGKPRIAGHTCPVCDPWMLLEEFVEDIRVTESRSLSH